MKHQKKSGNNVGHINTRKDREDFTTLKQIARAQWSKGPQTMKQVYKATGIVREHLCRFTNEWRYQGTMYVHHMGVCPVTLTDGVMFLAICQPHSLASLQRFIKYKKKEGHK